jgi:hypothetical protein
MRVIHTAVDRFPDYADTLVSQNHAVNRSGEVKLFGNGKTLIAARLRQTFAGLGMA